MYKAKDLANFCLSTAKEKSAYMWGEFGRKITFSTISQKATQYPRRYPKARKELLQSYVNKNYIGCDCAGLYKFFLWTDGGKHPNIVVYNSKTDRGTEGLYSASKVKGTIDTFKYEIGAILYKKGHIGIYVGDDKVVQCTLTDNYDGIVVTALSETGWTHWLFAPEIDYSEIVTEILKEEEPKEKIYRVIPKVGLWLNNSNKKWNSTTHIVCMPCGAEVTYMNETGKIGRYTYFKVKFNGKVGYCASDYLSEVK